MTSSGSPREVVRLLEGLPLETGSDAPWRRTSRPHFEENVKLFRPVPSPNEDFVCVRWLGPVREGSAIATHAPSSFALLPKRFECCCSDDERANPSPW